jgi:hypothetical protein
MNFREQQDALLQVMLSYFNDEQKKSFKGNYLLIKSTLKVFFFPKMDLVIELSD